MKRQDCCLAYDISGLVSVRYCNAPARLRYSVGFSSDFPSVAESFDLVSHGVVHGLQFDRLAQESNSVAN